MSRAPMSEYHSMKLGRVEGMARRNKEDIAKLEAKDSEIIKKQEVLDKKLNWIIFSIVIQILVIGLSNKEVAKFLLGILKAMV